MRAPLRVASYNIHRAVGIDGRRSPDRIADVIREIDADVLGLQEVDWHDEPGTGAPQYEILSRLEGYVAVAGPNLRDHRGHYGNLLLTRGTVERVRHLDLSVPGREPRGALLADLTLGAQRVLGVVTHFGLRLGERRRQAARLAETALAEEDSHPVLLLGDFNEWLPGAPGLRPLLERCDAPPGPRASFPARRPLLALDRVLSRGLPPSARLSVHASPLARAASDHLPVVADFEGDADASGATLPHRTP